MTTTSISLLRDLVSELRHTEQWPVDLQKFSAHIDPEIRHVEIRILDSVRKAAKLWVRSVVLHLLYYILIPVAVSNRSRGCIDRQTDLVTFPPAMRTPQLGVSREPFRDPMESGSPRPEATVRRGHTRVPATPFFPTLRVILLPFFSRSCNQFFTEYRAA